MADVGYLQPLCPACHGDSWRTRKVLKLYGMQICRRCYYGLINRRQLAWVIDVVLLFFIAFLVSAGMAMAGFGSGTTTSSAPLEVAIFLILETVFAIKDGFRGQSPGKFVLGVQVVDRTTLEPVGFRQSFLRNLPLYVPRAAYTTVILLTQSPFGAFLGLASLAIVLIIAIQMKNGPRLGDKFANTKVILVKRRFRPPFEQGADLRGVLHDESPGKDDADHAHQLDENVEARAGGVLEGVADGITDDGSPCGPRSPCRRAGRFSMYFFALSQAPPALAMKIATAKPLVRPPASRPMTPGTPKTRPTRIGNDDRQQRREDHLPLGARLVEIATQLA
jgi:uncharacterized RDD family membrane protein YckC